MSQPGGSGANVNETSKPTIIVAAIVVKSTLVKPCDDVGRPCYNRFISRPRPGIPDRKDPR
jgi:hypothetical protein